MDIFYQLVETIVILAVILIFGGSLFVRLTFSAHRVKQDHTLTPTVTVLMSCFNEGQAVYETIQKVLESDYPTDKLSVIVIDDCSKDDSWKWIQDAASGRSNVRVFKNEHNLGKSKSLLRALKMADGELILNVDSDGALHHRAIRELASCFVDEKIGGVGGNIMVRNANKNALTEMQALQYNMAFQISKVGETFSGSVNCISGALFMIRRSLYDRIAPSIESRSWLGMEVKEGEDRFMTNLILNLGFRTVINNRAKVFTDVPESFSAFFSQQLRWRRGFFRTFLWMMNPRIVKAKVNKTSVYSLVRLYGTALLAFLIPSLILWILMTHGIVMLIMMKLYLMLLICVISSISYVIATHIGNPLKLSAVPFLMLPLWTLVDLTFITALAGLTLGSASWETRT